MVQPSYPVGDFRTDYTGITSAILQEVTTTIKDVQTDLLKLISAKDILICHSHTSGESHRVLHLEHIMVVDTSHVFPHRDGPPKKSHIRFLAKQFLKRNIQDKTAEFDSNEDALAVLDLMKEKTKY